MRSSALTALGASPAVLPWISVIAGRRPPYEKECSVPSGLGAGRARSFDGGARRVNGSGLLHRRLVVALHGRRPLAAQKRGQLDRKTLACGFEDRLDDTDVAPAFLAVRLGLAVAQDAI